MMEVWKDIKGFEGLYQVSDLGRVKGVSRTGTLGGIQAVYHINAGARWSHVHREEYNG